MRRGAASLKVRRRPSAAWRRPGSARGRPPLRRQRVAAAGCGASPSSSNWSVWGKNHGGPRLARQSRCDTQSASFNSAIVHFDLIRKWQFLCSYYLPILMNL